MEGGNKTMTKILWATIAIVLIHTMLQAGTPVWINVKGLDGGFVDQVAVDPKTPSTVYAVTAGGLYKSTNGGATWRVPHLSLYELPYRMAIDPANTNNLYLAANYKVYKSTDGGSNWSDSSTGLVFSFIRDIEIDPSNSNVLYVAALDGVHKSVNAGAQWTMSSNGLGNLDLRKLTVDPTNHDVLYVATGGGIYRSYDAGADWAIQNAGLNSLDVSSVTVDPQHPLTLYAASADGVQKSINGSGSWTDVDGGNFSYTASVVVDPSNPANVYADFYKSGNFGSTWSPMTLGDGSITSLAIDPLTPSTLYASLSQGGVSKSTDSGATWTIISAGINSLQVNALDIHSSASFSGTADGVYYSQDGGKNWAVAGGKPTDPLEFTVMADPQNLATIYAGTNNGVYKRGLFGWSEINTGLSSKVVSKLLMDPTNSSILYAGTEFGGVFKSLDAFSWTAKNAGLVNQHINDLALDPVTPTRVYAATNAGVYLSTNGAASWGYVGPSASTINFVKHDPITALTVYTGVNEKLYKSTNGGSSWNLIATFNSEIVSLAIPPGQSSILYASEWFQVYRSTDGGSNWSSISAGLPYKNTGFMKTIASDPTNPMSAFAGTYDYGMFRLVDAYFWDDYTDMDISDWTVSPGWTATDTTLAVTTTKKAKAFSPNFGLCATCTMETDFRIETPKEKLTVYAWYLDSKNYLQLDLDEAKNTIKFSQKQGGTKVWVQKVTVDLTPQVLYHLAISYDGSNLHVTFDGNEVISRAAALPAAGKLGFLVKASSGISSKARFDNVVVY